MRPVYFSEHWKFYGESENGKKNKKQKQKKTAQEKISGFLDTLI